MFFYLTCGLGAAIAQISFLYYSFYSNLELLLSSGYDQQTVLNLLMEGKYNTGWGNILGPEGLMSFNTSFLSTMVGAAGAIMGILVAFGMFFPESKLMLIFRKYMWFLLVQLEIRSCKIRHIRELELLRLLLKQILVRR